MLIKFSNTTERLSLNVGCKIIPTLPAFAFPPDLQILALRFSLTHPSHVGLEAGEERKGRNNLSFNIQTVYSHGFGVDHGKQLKYRYDCSDLARENTENPLV